MSLPEDPRERNEKFPLTSIESHVRAYTETLQRALLSVSWEQLDLAISAILDVRGHGRALFVAGNGGSAAIADHLLCDWVKGTHTETKPPIHVHSLVASTALLTACANDFGYEVAFSRQLEMGGQNGDLLLTISASGNSPNILAAMRAASGMAIKTIAFTGFNGGKAREIADISIHVDAHNYGVVEDAFQALMHNLAQYIYGNSA
jgi:D-sedoheptulose 7-phosphate isomerase